MEAGMDREGLTDGAYEPLLAILLRMTLGMVAALLLTSGATAQNMLSKALFDCVRQGSPVILTPTKEEGRYYWRCEGLSAAALFSEMRGRTSESKTTDGSVVRWPSSGLSCTRDQTTSAFCLLSVDVGSEFLRQMR
jgi:hypothetical protein